MSLTSCSGENALEKVKYVTYLGSRVRFQYQEGSYYLTCIDSLTECMELKPGSLKESWTAWSIIAQT